MTTNQFPSIETPPDTLVLIPVLRSELQSDSAPVCLHLVHLEDGTLGLCNAQTSERCPCCLCPTCKTHQSQEFMVQAQDFVALCQTCALLQLSQRSALTTFVTRMTPQSQQEVKQAVKEVLQAFLRYKLPSRSEVRNALFVQRGLELTWQEVADIWYELRHEL